MLAPRHILILTVLFGAMGIRLMLPRGAARGRGLGILLAAIALGFGAAQVPRLGDWAADAVFLALAGVTIVAAAAAVTFRNPIYCAVWFGLSLLGTAGLLLVLGAQFLAAATVVVYAGAILVTFLFVLMLAQPEGKAPYDRTSWEPLLSASAGIVLVGLLSMTVFGTFRQAVPPDGERPPPAIAGNSAQPRAAVLHYGERPPSADEAESAGGVLAPDHVARLGGALYGRHLIAIEIVGILLFVALAGAAVIAMRGDERREEVGSG